MSPVKLFGPKGNSGSMPYNQQANNSGTKSEIVSPTEHPSNPPNSDLTTSGKSDQNEVIESISANDTNEHHPATPTKRSHKNSGYSKKVVPDQFADSKPERNQQKPHLVDGKLPDTVTTQKSPKVRESL
uniref:Uncharacterized protein n=1 Tax=Meloidogyne javanica TaxID=6303 RepID=A0A915LQE6_MELJA